MAEKSTEKKQVINVARTQWRGDDVAYRVGRVIAKVKVERGKPDPERVRRIADELAGELLGRRGDVVFAGPDRVTSVTVTPSDSRYAEQWGFPKIKADQAWDHQT